MRRFLTTCQIHSPWCALSGLVKVAILIGIIVSLASCKSRTTVKIQRATVNKDFYLKIDHTGCRGDCPNYWIEVESDGTTTYVGNKNVEMLGTWTKKLVSARMSEIAGTIDKAKFWNMDPEYGEFGSDLPAVIMTCRHNGEDHMIVHVSDAPPKLLDLQKKLEQLVGGGGWKRPD